VDGRLHNWDLLLRNIRAYYVVCISVVCSFVLLYALFLKTLSKTQVTVYEKKGNGTSQNTELNVTCLCPGEECSYNKLFLP